ncbi:MAG: hypothetical protein EOM91_12705 [Sphingobacteriia bacterium]|nr:hypothetical protein [Sphingobacteriia bacterium]NCC39459.1 hypothetical protein [Gammaproteobacteria bacterium]
MMKTTILALSASLILSTSVLAQETHSAIQALDRSANGLYTTSDGDAWRQQQQRTAAELEAEHLLARLHEADAIGGEALASAELAHIAETLTDPKVLQLLESSAYYQSVVAGRAPSIN